MRLLLLLTAAVLPSGAAAGPAPQSPAPQPIQDADKQSCDRGIVYVQEPQGPLKATPLTELPPANLYLTVLREVDNCPVPVVVRYNIGDAGAPAGTPEQPKPRGDQRPAR